MNSVYFIAFLTMVRKELTRVIRIWPQSILPSCITTLLYFAIFGNVIGRQVSNIDGFNYMTYIVPGLVMMAVINNAYMNVSSSFFGAKFQRNIDELLVAPVPNYIILLGYISGGLLRSLIVGIIVVFISLFFTRFHMHSWILMILTVIMSTTLFSLAGFINGIFANKFDDISIIPTFILTPLTYLGGVFYSVDMLPEPWRAISHFNPIFYIISAFRYTLLGVSDINFITAFGVILLTTIIFFAWAWMLLQRGVGIRS